MMFQHKPNSYLSVLIKLAIDKKLPYIPYHKKLVLIKLAIVKKLPYIPYHKVSHSQEVAIYTLS